MGASSNLLNAAFVPLAETEPLDPGRGIALITRPDSSLYEVSWTATGTGSLDLTLSVPRPGSGISFYVFSGVGIDAGDQGKVVLDFPINERC